MQPEHFGDGLLMRNGFTLVWVGWEFDVARLERQAADRDENGSPIVETIAALAVVDARATEVSFSDVPLYPPVDPNDETATLTVRDTVWDRAAAAAPPQLAVRRRRARTPADAARGDASARGSRWPRASSPAGSTS